MARMRVSSLSMLGGCAAAAKGFGKNGKGNV